MRKRKKPSPSRPREAVLRGLTTVLRLGKRERCRRIGENRILVEGERKEGDNKENLILYQAANQAWNILERWQSASNRL